MESRVEAVKEKRRPTRKQQHAALLRSSHKDGTYDRLLAAQDGVCAICKRSPDQIAAATGKPVRRLDIDHDHANLRIRGLLCRGDNMKLRKGITAEWMRKAADYLDAAA